MFTYDDLIKEDTTKVINFCKEYFVDLNFSEKENYWFALSYYYARDKGLAEFQSRSFASELTLFLTGKLHNSTVEHIYKEEMIDNHFFEKFEELIKKYPRQSKEFWIEFIEYMIYFYSSDLSLKYERAIKPIYLKLSDFELESFREIPMKKDIDKLNFLLNNYSDNPNFSYERVGDLNNEIRFTVTESVYQKFMNIPIETKTGRFLTMLYFYLSQVEQ